MSRADRRPRTEQIRALIDAGDHAGAQMAARAVLADSEAATDEREHAVAALASLAPERGALAAAAVGLAISVAVAVALAAG